MSAAGFRFAHDRAWITLPCAAEKLEAWADDFSIAFRASFDLPADWASTRPLAIALAFLAEDPDPTTAMTIAYVPDPTGVPTGIVTCALLDTQSLKVAQEALSPPASCLVDGPELETLNTAAGPVTRIRLRSALDEQDRRVLDVTRLLWPLPEMAAVLCAESSTFDLVQAERMQDDLTTLAKTFTLVDASGRDLERVSP